MKRILSFGFILFLFGSKAFSQDFSNKGKDFWVGYGYHQVMIGGNNIQEMVLYFATDQVTNITISIPSVGYTQTLTSGPVPGVLTSLPIPKSGAQDVRLLSESTTPENKGIHIVSDKPIVAYAHIYNQSVSGATILFPTNTLGRDYYSINYTNVSNSNDANCFFYVIASDTGTTTVEITPSAATLNHAAGVPFTVSLTQGQIYNIMGQYNNGTRTGVDLTGSRIKSLSSGTGGCKRIGVFSGSGRIGISCPGGASSSDNYMVQSFPQSAWGKKYLTTSTGGGMTNCIYRICVSDPTAAVLVNGAPITAALQGNFYYELPLTTQPQKIESNLPITVAQYITSQSRCGNGLPGDPEMIYLSPVEQNINKVQWNATNNFAISQSLYNVIIPNSGTAISSFTLDGVAVPPASFTVHPQDPGYSYLTQTVGSGQSHIIQSDSGFNAIAYGFGQFESYGYNAGTNVKDLYQQIGTATEYGQGTLSAVCTGTAFKFKISLPYQPDSLYLNFLGATNAPGPPPANVLLPFPVVADSITVVNGKTIYWYSFPAFYTFNNIGIYPIRITAYSPPVAGGCGSVQDIDFDLDVSAPPTINFTNTNPRCVAETVQFVDATTSVKPTYRWYWNFGDPGSGAQNISFLKNPSHVFSAPGTYNVRFNSITTAGCGAGDTIQKPIIIAALPSATVTGTATVCLNASSPVITFTGAGGSAPYTFTYNINGGAPQTITTTGTSNIATVSAPTNAAGTFIYSLTGVQNTGSALCNTAPIPNQSATIIVKDLPLGTITGTATVCQNGPSPLITFTGNTGTAPYTFSYNINGGATQTITSTAGNSVTVSAPTTTAGVFTYNLTGVTEGSANSCANVLTGQSAVITILPSPTATISGTTTVCQNATSPLISFTGSGGTAPYTFTYTLNGGAPQTITTVSGNSVTLAVSTTATGTFTYVLTSVKDGTASPCVGPVNNATAVVTVNPLPTATISGNASVCVNATSPVVTFTGASGTAPYIFNYTLNGVAQTPIVSSGNTATITVPTTTANVFTYVLTSVTDGSSTACSGPASGSVVVTIQALPTGTISGTIAVCQNAAPPLITFTGSAGTTPYTFTYNINGGATQTISTTGSNTSMTITVPTAVTGSFVYTLLTVKESSTNGCLNTISPQPTATVTVNPLPTATIAGGTNVCLNATSPIVTFTGAGGTAPYRFTFTINGITQPVLISTGNTATINVPTGVAGTFNYQLVSVQDGSSTACSQVQNGSTVFVIYPQPIASFTYTIPSCDTRDITFNSTASTAGAGTITGYSWSFGDPASGAANNSTLQNPVHLFSAAGTFNVTLTITTSNNCNSSVQSTSVTITPRPQAGFILPRVCLLDPFAQFTDTSRIANPGTITGWEWNFGDPASGAQNTSTLQNPQHTYTLVGPYNVRLIAISNTGCRDTLVQVLIVNGGNPQSNFIQENAANCANDSVGVINKSTIASGNITRLEIYWDNTAAPTVFDFDDNPVFNKIYRHKYPDFQSPLTKTFNVRVRAFSGGVCFSDKTIPVTVNASPKVQFLPIPNACYNQAAFQITQASEIGGVPGTGSYTGPGVSLTGLFDPAGQPIGVPLTIKYKFTSSAAGCKDSATQTITLLDTASARFTFVAPVCEGSAASFTEQSTTPSGITLQNTVWNFGDGTAPENHAPGSTFTHIFPGTGTFQVTMYNVSTNSCRSATFAMPVLVRPIPRPSFTFDKTDYCLPNAVVNFNSSASTIADGTQSSFTYIWFFGDPASGASNTSTLANPSHTYATAGTYTISLQIKSGAGCVHDTSIILNRLHPLPVASFDFAKNAICADQDAVVIDRSTGADGTITNWAWNFGDGAGTSAIQNPPPYHYNSVGTYKVKLEVTNSFGCKKDTTKTIDVYPYPIVDAGPRRYVLENGSVTLQPIVTAVQPRYLWTWNVSDPTGYLNNPQIKNPISSPLSDVLYTLTVTGLGECSSSDTVFIKLLMAPKIPNTFSPNNDGINDFWEIRYLDTYPKAKVQVFNRTGQLVFQSKGYPKPWDGNMNGKSLPVDTYYYVIEPENGRAPITGYVTIIK